METNHNAWTLTKHLAGTINRAAGKVDETVYGNGNTNITVQIPPNPPIVHNPTAPSFGGAVLGILGFAILIAFVFVWMGKVENFKNRLLGGK